jgi:TPR repeat protein
VPKAIELWSKAADAGNVTARFNLGLQYAAGVGVKKDMKKAAEYLLQAAESGLPEAQFAVAGYYRDGTGVPKDMDAARQWYDRAASAGFEPARKELAAIDKPAVSSTPSVEEGATSSDNQQAQKTETPPAEAAKPENPPAESQGTAPSETEQSPAEGAKQEPAPPVEAPPVEAATTGHAPEEAGAPQQEQAAEEEPAESPEKTPENPTGEGTLALDPNDPRAELPVAESLTGDARTYRIWLYESGQEGDARSYWDKLTMQYPGRLKKLELDLRRYFLGEAKGSLYRVFAGPFKSLGDAQEACEDIRTRFGDQFCRPVLN